MSSVDGGRWIASLPMYDLAPLRRITDAWWHGLARCLAMVGIDDVPTALERDRSREQQWSDPRLLLSQTCGYPLATAFRSLLVPLLTPCYRLPGCRGAHYSSALVVREDDPATELGDLANATFAVNGRDSWSGWHALGRELAARDLDPARFVGEVYVSGMHAESIRAVASGRARAAAIDCVTHALIARHAPDDLLGTRVLTHTDHAPCLPYVTSVRVDASTRQRIRDGLRTAAACSSLAAVRDALGIEGFEALDAEDYAFMAGFQL